MTSQLTATPFNLDAKSRPLGDYDNVSALTILGVVFIFGSIVPWVAMYIMNSMAGPFYNQVPPFFFFPPVVPFTAGMIILHKSLAANVADRESKIVQISRWVKKELGVAVKREAALDMAKLREVTLTTGETVKFKKTVDGEYYLFTV